MERCRGFWPTFSTPCFVLVLTLTSLCPTAIKGPVWEGHAQLSVAASLPCCPGLFGGLCLSVCMCLVFFFHLILNFDFLLLVRTHLKTDTPPLPPSIFPL